ncbi:hypothetical protein J4455_04025 [Candidatus Woesearchaeota archaeon]|nr:hypothetical protein [Candidatus Woesearchaeota archaeon]
MARKNKKPRIIGKVVFILAVILVVYLVSVNAYLFNLNSNLNSQIKQIQESKNNEDKKETFKLSVGSEGNYVDIKLPAVNKDSKGVITNLEVRAIKGNGKTLVDIDNLLFWADTQNSIRMAKEVASEVTNMNLNDVDLYFGVEAGDAQIISGPSAGAALAIATIAAVEGKTLNDKVMITGTVNHDGTIGPVGEIAEKAKAAKEAGAEIFLVPLLQGQEVIYERTEHCQKFGGSQFCTIEQIPKKINIEKEIGIKVVEVQNIKEAMSYFYS